MYDGGIISFQGLCTYLMSFIPDTCRMHVYVKNRALPERTQFTLVEYVVVMIANDIIILDQHRVVKVSTFDSYLKVQGTGNLV